MLVISDFGNSCVGSDVGLFLKKDRNKVYRPPREGTEETLSRTLFGENDILLGSTGSAYGTKYRRGSSLG